MLLLEAQPAEAPTRILRAPPTAGRPPALTPGNAQHPHDADDGGVDGQGRIDLDLLQRDAHDRQQHDGQVQLVPPARGAEQWEAT